MVIANPRGIAVGPDGSLYVGQYSTSGRVYKVHPTSGATSIVASNLNLPTRLAVDPTARVLYVSEIDGRSIRRYDLDTQQGSVFVNFPTSRITDLNVGPDGSVYFVAMDNRTVRRVPRDWNGTGTPEIVAGQAGVTCTNSAVPSCGDGGPATSASLVFWEYSGIAIGADGSLYIATSAQRSSSVGHRIRWVDAATGIIHTVAGTGVGGYSGEDVPATTAQINRPSAMELLDGDILIFADTDNHRVRWLGRQNLELQGIVQDHRGAPLAGAVVTARSSLFAGNATTQTAADGSYSLFPRLTAMSGTLTLEAQYTRLRSPQTTMSITLQTGDLTRRTLPLSITERQIRVYGTIRNTLTTEPVRGMPATVTIQHAGQPLCITQTTRDGTYSCTTNTTQLDALGITVQASGAWQSPVTTATVPAGSAAQITSVQVDPALTPTTLRLSGTIARADTPVAAARVELDLPNGQRVLTYTNAAGVYQLDLVLPPAVNTTRLQYHISDGNLAPDFSHYLSESLSIATPATLIARTRSIDLAAPDAVVRGSVARTVVGSGFSGFFGDGGLARAASLNSPQGLAVAADGTLYIADTTNHRIRRVTPDGMITTVAGGGVALDGDSTRAATSVRLTMPTNVLLAPDGSLYIADTGNHRIRRIAPDGTLSTLAGSGTSSGGYSGDGGAADTARLNSPNGLALHPDGSVYIADTGNHRIRRIAPDGTISTVAGNGSAGATGDSELATTARLNGPQGIALALDGTLYIADSNNHRIRVVSPDGIIRTLAGNGSAGSIGDGGLARDAQLNMPTQLVLDQAGTLYLADTSNQRIRMITPDGIIRTRAGSTSGFSGDGALASTARFLTPSALALAQDGTLYVADRSNHRIRTLGRTSLEIIGTVRDQLGSPVANASLNGSGTLLRTALSSSSDQMGTYRFFPEQPNPSGTLTLETMLTTSAGSLTASQSITASLAPDHYTQLQIPLTFTERYVRVAGTILNGTTGTALGDIASTIRITADEQTVCSTLARADGTYACTFRTARSAAFTTELIVTGAWGTVSTPAPVPAGSAPIVTSVSQDITAYPTIIRLSGQLTDAGSPVAHARIAVENRLNVAIPQARTHTDSNGAYQLDIPLNATVTSTDLYLLIEQRLRAGTTIGTSSTVNTLQLSQLNAVQLDLELSDPGYTSAPLVATTRAGTGMAGYTGDSGGAETARLYNPNSVAVAPDGSLYIADTFNNRIRRVAPDGSITTVAGNGSAGFGGDGGQATSAYLYNPRGVAVDSDGSLYIADTSNNRIRRVDPNGIITTVAGNGTYGFSGDGMQASSGSLRAPASIAIGLDGSLYIADTVNHRIRRVAPNGIITTVAGNGTAGFTGDSGTATNARLNRPQGIAVGVDNSLYIADTFNNRIRKVAPNGIITTIAGTGLASFSGDDGTATGAALNVPYGVQITSDGMLVIADSGNQRVRIIWRDGIITTLAGNGTTTPLNDDAPAPQAALNTPTGLGIGPDGSILIAESTGHRIRQIAPPALTVYGTLTDAYDSPVADAELRININDQQFHATSNAEGFYTLPLNIAAVQASEPLLLTAFLHGQHLSEYAVSVPDRQPGGLHTKQVNLQITERVVQFEGQLINDYTGDVLPLPSTIEITANGNLLCRTTSDALGNYSCTATTDNLDGFSVDYAVQGLWGSATCEGCGWVGWGTASDLETTTSDLYLYPTMLSLSGTIEDLNGNSINGTVVELIGADLLPSYTSVSNPYDYYDIYALVPEGVTEVTVRLRVSRSSQPDLSYEIERTYYVEGNTGEGETLIFGPGADRDQLRRTISTRAGQLYASFWGDGGLATSAYLNTPAALTQASDGSIYIADRYNQRIRKIDPDGIITTVAGTGVAGFNGDGIPAVGAHLNSPQGLAVGFDGSLYIADTNNQRIRKIDPDGIISTVAGTGTAGFSGDNGQARNANLRYPSGLAVGFDGSLYIADTNNHRIRKVAPNGIITTVAGTGVAGFGGDSGQARSALLNYPRSLAVAPDSSLYIADTNNQRIRMVWTDGIITTLAGTGQQGFAGDNGPAKDAHLYTPFAILLDQQGNLLFSDQGNHRIRQITPIIVPAAPPQGLANPNPITLWSNGIAETYPSEIEVVDVAGAVNSMRVTLHGLTHHQSYDLAILLEAPDGSSVMLMSFIGDGSAMEDLTLTFDDNADTLLGGEWGNEWLESGSFQPHNAVPWYDESLAEPAPQGPHGTSLNELLTSDPNGVWRLYIYGINSYGERREGSLTGGWSLDLMVNSGRRSTGGEQGQPPAVPVPRGR
ncbi:MAG: hypothetical protein HC911_12380 [Chloroflexaceae bacterium]|nr:hypothetical protein [Chloroflexaceae bacterium]